MVYIDTADWIDPLVIMLISHGAYHHTTSQE